MLTSSRSDGRPTFSTSTWPVIVLPVPPRSSSCAATDAGTPPSAASASAARHLLKPILIFLPGGDASARDGELSRKLLERDLQILGNHACLADDRDEVCVADPARDDVQVK